MNQVRAANGSANGVSRRETAEMVEPSLAHLTVLVATAEPAISANMRELLHEYKLKTIWAKQP